ncbi:TetR/AcrR family transcriptional regulator [Kocuria palustris]|uniref:TetR/AcrR family transcriptional regulator n=1 Tax=Kocuria palustris TaxID=71999 RepID=UPI0011A337BD|nr:TetR/AcrR family transcriptional regulator [Kocuria palustris]
MTPPADKREATKWRNRRAIIDAAAELASEHGADGVTVKALAERAGVSRRTIFNHFTTVDEAVFESFSDRIGSLYEQIEQRLGDSRFRTLSEACTAFAAALRSVDVLGAVHSLLGPVEREAEGIASDPSKPPSTSEIWSSRIVDGIVRSCAESLQSRIRAADPFETRLFVELVVTAMATSLEHRAETTDRSLSPASRQEWDLLLSRGLRHLEAGFGQRPAA